MKTILVSGGNRGIGLEICRQLDALGHNVIMACRNTRQGVNAAVDHRNTSIKQLDITDEDSITKLFANITEEYGSIDVLINNAAIGPVKDQDKISLLRRSKRMIESVVPGFSAISRQIAPGLKKAGIVQPNLATSTISLDNARQLMETNLFGTWRLIQVSIPLLQKSGSASLINISSGSGALESLSGEYPAYSLSKTAVNALTIMLSNELKQKKIKVNAVCPGWVRTDMGGPNAPRSVEQGADTAVWLAIKNDVPTGKFFRDRKEINW